MTLAENGTRGLALGWAPTFFGYSSQVSEIKINVDIGLPCLLDISIFAQTNKLLMRCKSLTTKGKE